MSFRGRGGLSYLLVVSSSSGGDQATSRTTRGTLAAVAVALPEGLVLGQVVLVVLLLLLGRQDDLVGLGVDGSLDAGGKQRSVSRFDKDDVKSPKKRKRKSANYLGSDFLFGGKQVSDPE